MIISLDLMVALPIVAVSVVLLFGCLYATQYGISQSATYQKNALQRLEASQLIASGIEQAHDNYSSSLLLARSLAQGLGVNESINGSVDQQACDASLTVCRLITVNGSSYFLVIT